MSNYCELCRASVKVDKLEAELAEARQVIEFCFDNVHHEEKCRYPKDECFCMDRTFFNDSRVYDRCLAYLKELEGEE